MKRFTICLTVLSLLLFGAVSFADDAPVAPVAAAAADTAKPADAAKPADTAKPAATVAPKSDDPVADAGKVIDDGIAKIGENPVEAVSTLVQMAKEGRWGPFVGLALMFLIWILRKFIWKLIPKNALPWVTLGVGMVATGAIELGLGVVWWKVLIDSLGTSGIAMGFWSLLFKHIMKPKEEEVPES